MLEAAQVQGVCTEGASVHRSEASKENPWLGGGLDLSAVMPHQGLQGSLAPEKVCVFSVLPMKINSWAKCCKPSDCSG